jgi:hypothetical protein
MTMTRPLCSIGVLLALALLAACAPVALAPVSSPAAVTERARPLAGYDDRLMDALAGVIGRPDAPSAERVIVVASPKIELMLFAAGLAGGWDLMSANVPSGALSLRESAVKHAGAVGQHDAIRHLGQLRSRGFWYDALPRLALTFSDPPALEQIYPVCDYLRGRSPRGEQDLRDFMTRLRDFATVIRWDEWWQANEAQYRLLEEHCRLVYTSLDPLGILERYFGERLDALVIIPSGMIACGFGGTIEDPLGTWAINCFGPATGRMLPDSAFLDGIVLHEGGHAFVNHHAAENRDLVRKYASLYSPISVDMQRQAYGNWETALNEHVLRACHARLELQRKGEAAAERMLALDESRGFRYVRALYAKLAEYEADRVRYPDFASFYPELLTALRGL